MKNLKELFKSIVEIQPLIEKRGYELINARDFYKERPERINIHRWAKELEFEEDGVICTYSEDTSSDITEQAGCKLSIELLEKTEDEWNYHIEYVKSLKLKEFEEKTKRNKEYELVKTQKKIELLESYKNKLEEELEEENEIKVGDLVEFTSYSEAQVNFGSCSDPIKNLLKIGNFYRVSNIEVHSWHTKFELENYPDRKFNSVHFTKVKDI
jgi:hypothetical protein